MNNPYLIIGTIFAALLVLFLTIAYFADRKENQTRWIILRVLSSICAGAAGGFLTGEAVFRLSASPTPGSSLFIGGTAGIALFLTVWFGFGRLPPTPTVHPDGFSFSIGIGFTFERVAQALASSDGARAVFQGFDQSELNAQLSPQRLEAADLATALKSLGALAIGQKIRPYSVSLSRPLYTFTIQ